MVLVSQQAPNFCASAVLKNGTIINDFNLKKYSKEKITVLFFWPMDFTFVCPSEIIAFNNVYDKFKKRNVRIVGISVDSVYVHQAWRNTKPKNGGIGLIKFPMISDITKSIQKSYGVEHKDLTIALRATFIIDKGGIIRHQSINDLPIGRNIKEIIRIIDAFQLYEKFGEVCPANWNPGKPSMQATSKGVKKYLSENLQNI